MHEFHFDLVILYNHRRRYVSKHRVIQFILAFLLKSAQSFRLYCKQIIQVSCVVILVVGEMMNSM